MNTLRNLLVGLVIGLLGIPAVQADPPRWAPAYGYRYQHQFDRRHHADRHYRYNYPRYNSRVYYNSRCNGEVFGTVLGSAVGGAIGSSAARDRTAGTITGLFVGAVVGNVIGRSMDASDRRCGGH